MCIILTSTVHWVIPPKAYEAILGHVSDVLVDALVKLYLKGILRPKEFSEPDYRFQWIDSIVY